MTHHPRQWDETNPSPALRPGSRGEAVRDLQERLNAVHARLAADGGLAGCPLEVDGAFGPLTRGAVLSFQRQAFPGEPGAWDGVVGPRTRAALDAFAAEGPRGQVGPAVLDPDRWGPLLSAAMPRGSTLRTGNALRTLIDGAETFAAMVSDLRAASGETDYIYLLGWDIVDDFALVPTDPTSTVRQLLTAASGRNVQIRVILWAKPPLANLGTVRFVNRLANGAALRDDHTANNHPFTATQIASLLLTAGVSGPVAAVLAASLARDPVALTGSHHQKVLIVKRGDRLVAYCGGIDINANRLLAVSPSTGDPQHDAHCRIVGPAAWDLLQTFMIRWRHHPQSQGIDTGRKGPLRGTTEPPVPALPSVPVGSADAPLGGTTSVVIARTFNPTRRVPGTPPVVAEQGIRALLHAAIRGAQRFIYLEDQYLIDLEVADMLNGVLRQIQHVTILIPGSAITEMPFIAEYRRDFVAHALLGLPAAAASRLRIFQRSLTPNRAVFGPHSYVHAKTWVIDDELAIIGSANCNRRGYQHDSEVDAFAFGRLPPGGRVTSLAQAYRVRLWAEHLGLGSGASLTDGVAAASLWLRGSRPAKALVTEFDHRLPTSIGQSVRDRAADAARAIIDPVP